MKKKIKIDNYMGVGKVSHEGKEFYVSFASYFYKHEGYDVIGKGDTENEALKDGIRNLLKKLRKVHDQIENFRSRSLILDDYLKLDDKPIIPVPGEKGLYHKDGPNEGEFYWEKDPKKIINARAFIKTNNTIEIG